MKMQARVLLPMMALSCFSIPTMVSAEAVSALSDAKKFQENMEAAVPRPEQQIQADNKLAALKQKTGKRPNVLILMVDDLGYGDVGAFGGGVAIGAATPNIDALAQGGLKLTSTYSQTTCTPTRSAMITGRLPVRTGLYRPILAGDKLTANPWDDEVTSAKLMSDAGYETILTGKWHVGEAVGMRPQDVGFDEFYGYYRAQKEYVQAYDKRRYPDLVLDKAKFAKYQSIEQSQGLVHGFKNGKTEDLTPIRSIDDMANADRLLKEFTVNKIKALAKGDKPFYLQHSFMKTHADNHPPKAFEGASASKYAFKDAVVEVDAYVGEIVEALRESGQLENTLIFFTSDNGPQSDSWPDAGYTPFRGGKGTGWEGAVRIPGIAYWKGMIKPGQVSDGLFDLMDIFNTSVALAGVEDKIPSDKYIDGIDQTAFLLADNGKSMRDKVFIWSQKDFLAMRMNEYKIHFKVITTDSQFLNIDMATIKDIGLAPWLFNLYIDPKEQYPVGHRRNAWLGSMGAESKAHAATFKKYPPKDVGL
ncbi:arylsulfatase [Shewanella benthica]|uniref:arylsulfatase n=1 Tax=Shewanella benthica TaxID=43661 RepID=UPI001D0D3160|nr:arylsulfatase [Shewanella benthica]MCL1064410.1 arylsulfatase [Shewanella benthica]